MDKLVSIIMPIYNIEKYLERSIMCVLKQTYKRLELILVDDGSTDNSGKICDKLGKRDNRITVIHKLNGGLSDARNVGLMRAKGEYIYFFDPDDYIALNLVEVCVRAIEIKNCDFVVFNYRLVRKDVIVGTSHFRCMDYVLHNDQERFSFLYNDLLEYSIGWEAWNRFYQTKFIKQNKLNFWDNNKIFAEDLAFMITAMNYVEKISVLDENLYYYEVRETSIMGRLKQIPINKYIYLGETIIARNIFRNIAQDDIKKIAIKIVLHEIDKSKDVSELNGIIANITKRNRDMLTDWIDVVLAMSEIDRWEYYSLKKMKRLLEEISDNTDKDYLVFLYYRKLYKNIKKFRRKFR